MGGGNDTSRTALITMLAIEQPDGSTVDPAFFVEMFGKMDAKWRDSVVLAGLPSELSDALSRSFGIHDPRLDAIVEHLGVGKKDIRREGKIFFKKGDDSEYVVLTDSEADDAAHDYITENIEYFNRDFIERETGIPRLEDMIGEFEKTGDVSILYENLDGSVSEKRQQERAGYKLLVKKVKESITSLPTRGQDVNGVLNAIVESTCGTDQLVKDAVESDGRGHFLSGYDGEENLVYVNGVEFYIYRTN